MCKAGKAPDVNLILGDVLEAVGSLPDNHFDLVLSSPPYNINKAYEREEKRSFDEYLKWQASVIEALLPKVRDTGSICWQVGSFVRGGEIRPLDFYFYSMFRDHGLQLRNRIIWRFNFGLNADKRFSGRYETLLWFTKTSGYKFNLDPVRIPQLYPGKRYSKRRGSLAGQPSGNPRGKNPSDYWEFSAEKDFRDNPVWDIPNVKANHPEKTVHPCQFPIELAERCVLALTMEGDHVLDPFVGTGASVIAAKRHGRRATGIDKDRTFIEIASDRLSLLETGALPLRQLGRPVRRPKEGEKVATVPREWVEST